MMRQIRRRSLFGNAAVCRGSWCRYYTCYVLTAKRSLWKPCLSAAVCLACIVRRNWKQCHSRHSLHTSKFNSTARIQSDTSTSRIVLGSSISIQLQTKRKKLYIAPPCIKQERGGFCCKSQLSHTIWINEPDQVFFFLIIPYLRVIDRHRTSYRTAVLF